MGRYAVSTYALLVVEEYGQRHNEHAHGLLILDSANEETARISGLQYARRKCPAVDGWDEYHAEVKVVDDNSKPLMASLAQEQSDRMARLRDEKATLRAILSRLVAAKDEKDAHGETDRYRELKAGAWDRAREILAEIA